MPWDTQFDKRSTLEKVKVAFWSRGFEATSMQDLVDATGVHRASLYATYGDKRNLFIASLRSYDEQRQRMLIELENKHTPREAIRQVFLAFTKSVRKSGNKGCFITNTSLELAAHDVEVRKVVARAQTDVEAFFKRMIEKGQKTSEIKNRIDPMRTAQGLLASLTGLLVLVRSRPDKDLLTAIVDDAMGRIA